MTRARFDWTLRRVAPLLAAFSLLLGAGCGDDDDGPSATPSGPALSSGQDSVLKGSWVYYVVEDPARLAPFEQGATGDAWLAIFHNDLRSAVRALTPLCVAQLQTGTYPYPRRPN